MDMATLSGFLWSVTTSTAVSAGLCAVMIWLVKSSISARLSNAIRVEYDQKLEGYKAQLKAQSEVELEKLRSSLQIAAVEHQTKFASLHTKRAEVIAKTYAKLKPVYFRISEYTKAFEFHGEMPRAERGRLAAEAHKAFHQYYSGNLIFLPKPTADALDRLNRDLVGAFNRFAIMVDGREDRSNNAFDIHMDVLDKLEGEIQENLTALEEDFRKILG